MNLYFHFSFDVIDVGENFDNRYKSEAKRFLLCLLTDTGAIIESNVASTFILTYDTNSVYFQSILFSYLHTQIDDYFHYEISAISYEVLTDGTHKLHKSENSNENLQIQLTTELGNLDCQRAFTVGNYRSFADYFREMERTITLTNTI